MVAGTINEFEEKLKDDKQLDEWFMIRLTSKLRQSKERLKKGQLYSYKQLPIIGGGYTVDNFAPLNIVEHFGYTGEVYNQMQDFPDGTSVNIKFV